MKPYLDACIASRVHFQFFHPLEMARQGHFMNDCIYGIMNHAKWLATSMDGWVSGDPGWSEVFRWGPHLERARQGLKLCQIHQQKIVSFPFGESQLSPNYFTIKIAVARVYSDVRFLGFTSFWVRPSLVSWKKIGGQNCRSWSSKCSFCTSTSRHLWDFISSLGSQSRSAEAVHKRWQRLSNLDRLPYTVQGLWKWIQSLQASIITGSQGGTWTMNI